MEWIIYKHTNKVNGKVYVGQTKQTLDRRWRNGVGYTRDNCDTHFARAINKYGCMAAEMESFALYVNAAKLRKKALCFLTVTDSFIHPEKLTSKERAFGLGRMIELAITTAEKFCD